MSLLRAPSSQAADRPSVLIKLKLTDKLGVPVDASLAWLALKDVFKDHPHLQVTQAEIGPDRGSSIE